MSANSIAVCAAAFIIIADLLKKKKRKKRWWITKLYANRSFSGRNAFLNSALLEEDASGHLKNIAKISSEDFYYLLELIREQVSKKDTKFRNAVTAEERLAITLRYLATGETLTTLQNLFKVSKQLISTIIPEVCRALVDKLSDYVKVPSSVEEWIAVSRKFEDTWDFPHCLGSIGGKHILLQAPFNSGSTGSSDKSQVSIVLMAVVDADYNFIFADVVCQEGISDGGLFKNCTFYKDLEKKKIRLPIALRLLGRNIDTPFLFIADEAFALSENIMKPYSGLQHKGSKERIFNYRLNRARQVADNAFGILASVFKCLRKPMLLQPEKAQLVTMTIVCLHNFLRNSSASRNIYSPEGTFDRDINGERISGSWRQDSTLATSLIPLKKNSQRSTLSAKNIRDEFAEYFITNGSVSWQNEYA